MENQENINFHEKKANVAMTFIQTGAVKCF